MTIQLVDYGTLDTVFRCVECHEEWFFNYASTLTSDDFLDEDSYTYDDFIHDCLDEIRFEHGCCHNQGSPQ